ncbi:MAG: PBP1A family penicillin-binding protein [Clostridia bacterium]|nr:PBP1A family penicillin-binding protein [Clostridia bacterium]
MDDRDLFSYDNSNNGLDEGQASFDLNSFSTQTQQTEKETKKPKFTKQKIIKTVLTCFLIGVITVAIVAGSFLIYAFTMVDGTVDYNLNDPQLNFTTTVYVQNKKGNWEEYQRLHGMYNRIWVEYDENAIEKKDENYDGIPANLANAFIAIEDKGFETHYGVDWKRTFGALLNEFFHFSDKFGGSTITQQLVKNLTDDREQDAGRKVREIMRARYLETKYTKDVILECYLNTIPMGHGTYGVEVAANYYFNKSVNELTIPECACLAAITKAPSYYAPDTNPENNKKRRNTVLYEMMDQGYITKEEYDEAVDAEIKITVNESASSNNEINSYFVDALISQVTQDLCDKYGYTIETAEQLFYNGGYKIYATVDTNVQSVVEKAYLDVAANAKPSSKGDPLWGAMTVMDYEGNVKGIVGGIGEKTKNRAFNCATDAKRQPGSTMKPISVYAPAIENGVITYSSMLNDTKATYGKWSPKNASGGYLGNITAQEAIERSINTIPVALANKMGVQTCYDFLTQKLGLKNLTEQDLNLSSLGLGGTSGGITTLESAAAYAVFGNGGLYYEPTFYTKVTDQKGNIILEKNNKPVSALSEDTATVMNKLLQTVIYEDNGTGKAVASAVSGMKLFGKTGTSSSNNDKWFVGGSPYYVVSSWCGYETMQNMPSANLGIARSQWSTVMSKIHSGLEAKDFPQSKFAVDRYYCTETGSLATVACESKAIGWYKKGKLPDVCQKHSGELMMTPEEIAKAEENAATEGSSQPTDTSSTASQN